MVEIIICEKTENQTNAKNVYEQIENILSPDYTIYDAMNWFGTDVISERGQLNCFIEKNTHRGLLSILNNKIGRLVYDGESSIAIKTKKQEHVIDAAERIESLGYSVVIMISEVI